MLNYTPQIPLTLGLFGLGALGIFLLTTAVSIGVSLLLKPKVKSGGAAKEDDSSPTVASRGAFIPLIIGTWRVGPVITWVNRGFATRLNQGGGDQFLYKGSAMHCLCIGPGRALLNIRQDNTVIYKPSTPITPTSHPSGTRITIPRRRDGYRDEEFAIYWGERDQPINRSLAGRSSFPAKSRWPHIMYIEWITKDLLFSRRWPDLQYTLTAGCNASLLAGAGAYELTSGDSVGVNPAQAMFQLHTAKFPHGVGMEIDLIDTTTLANIGQIATTEHLPCNIGILEGDEMQVIMKGFLADLGMLIPQVEGRIVFMPMRDPGATPVPEIDNDIVATDLPELQFDREFIPVGRVVFTYKSEKLGFRDADILISNDGDSVNWPSPKITKVEIITATHKKPANTIANRRTQEVLGKEVGSTFNVLRSARKLIPGQLFDFNNIRYLTLANTPSGDGPTNRLGAMVDSYSIPSIEDEQTEDTPDEPAERSANDLAFNFFEIPAVISGTPQPTIIVFRARAHQGIVSALIWLSKNNVNFTEKRRQQSASASGLILSGVSADVDELIPIGPVFEPETRDVEELVLDLTADTAAWESGEQIGCINGEIFYIQNATKVDETNWASGAYSSGDFVKPDDSILDDRTTGLRYESGDTGNTGAVEPDWPGEIGDTVVDGDITWTAKAFSYTPINMIRAQYGTEQATHSIGDRFYMIPREHVAHIRHALIEAGVQLCVKTQAYTQFDEADLSTVTSVCKTISGASWQGVPTGSFWTDDTGAQILTNGSKPILFWANFP